MRWESMLVSDSSLAETGEAGSLSPELTLFDQAPVVRTFDSPHFAGMTFYEVQAKSIINKVPSASRVPFSWTINPYRGCSHACRYCFARNTHTYLDLDAGLDFDTKVVVKVNAPELLRRELAKPAWRGEPIAMGTNVDCYQRAEGRNRLMPGIISALTERANPFSILTKGSLILRDLDLLRVATHVTEVSTAVSVGFLDQDLWREIEPGTPSPAKRLDVCGTLNAAGVRCGVLMAPILPGLTDSPEQLAAAVAAIARAGARYVTPIVLHLRPGSRAWFMSWLANAHPQLVPMYERLYARSAYAPKSLQAEIRDQVYELARAAGLDQPSVKPAGGPRRATPPAEPAQLELTPLDHEPAS